MAKNLNIKQQVNAGTMSDDDALSMLRKCAGDDLEKTTTYRWLMRRKLAKAFCRYE